MKSIRYRWLIACLFGCFPCISLAAADDVIISEFMAANDSMLADEDGEFSDWIELHNGGANSVNLNGWHLTDAPAQLTKWRFPAASIAANGYLVVFASGKDRRVLGAPLHTNFRLSADGEYLALVRPDGTTVASEYAPAFPPQLANVSFGLDPGLRQETLLAMDATGRLVVPSDSGLGSNWTNPDFDDSSWRSVTNAVGFLNSGVPKALTNALAGYWRFDEASGASATDSSGNGNAGTLVNFPGDNSEWIHGRVNRALAFRGGSQGDYVRVPDYPKATTNLSVAAWVWADARPTWATIAKNWGASQPGQFHLGLRDTASDLDIHLRTSSGQFNVRENVPLPLGQWQQVAFVADGSMLRLYRNGNLVASGPYSGSLISPPMSALGLGVKLNDAGSAPDAGAPGFWQGRLDEVAIWNRALSGAEIQTLAQATGSYGEFIGTDVAGFLRGVNASCYLRFSFVVDNPLALTRWLLRVRYDDGFVAWLNGEEVVRRNAPATVTWNSAATNRHGPAVAIEFEDFSLEAFEGVLRPGTNVLAVQALNLATDDDDFLMQPVMEASSITTTTNARVYFTTPTPGRENNVGLSVLGPVLSGVTHIPAVPDDNDDLIVTARVSPAFGPVASVALHYRVMFAPTNSIPMFDDGAHGDGAAGDGVYGAIIPASASTNGQMIRYFITAQDDAGTASRLPLFRDALGSMEYFGTMVQPPANSSLPVLHWFVANPTAADTDTGTRCSLFFDGELYDNVFVRMRGGTSRGWPKKSYKMEMPDDHHFLLHRDWPRVDEINLNTTYTDKSYVRTVLTAEHMRDAGLPAPDAYLMQVRQNNAFFSVAICTEQVDPDFLRRHGANTIGALYKGNQGASAEVLGLYEKKTRRQEDPSDLQAFLTSLQQSGSALETVVFDQVDVPELVNYMAVMATTQDIDGTDKNHYLYRDTAGTREWSLIPYDLDLTFGPNALNTDTIVYNQQNVSGPACASHPFIGARPYMLHANKYNRLLEAIVNTPRTRQMLLRRLRTLSEQFLASGYFQRRIDELVAQIGPDVLLDKARWGGNAHFSGGSYTLQQAADRIKNEYLAPRVPFLMGTNIVGIGATNPLSQPFNAVVAVDAVDFSPASGQQPEEFIRLTNPAPFAVDLSGWRLEGAARFSFRPGTVLPAADVLYVSPEVNAFRARSTGPRGGQRLFVQGPYQGQLSARGETIRLIDTYGREVNTFSYPGNPSLAQQHLRITEIMFHPTPLAGNTNDAEEFEFIELKNISESTAVDLTGVRFINGINFDFTGGAVTTLAPGAHVLVVKNLAAFAARYGNGFPMAGQYDGYLNNNGDRLQLVDAAGEEILDFTFHDGWHPVSDGLGFSIVVIDEMAEPDRWGERTQWRASGSPGGSPGTIDPASPVIAPVVINEVLTRTDTPPPTDSIELHNPADHPVDVGGWLLTDDFNTPRKFRVPDSTLIPANGYLVFDESQFNPGGTGFALGSDGDEVWLFSADAAGNLTGYVHGHAFGAADDGASFGRHLTSAGEAHFVAQAALTLGRANAAPRVGPVVINEILYRPPDVEGTNDNSADEFIELLNTSSAAVPLFDPLNSANTWRIAGGVDFVFPTNHVLAAGEHLLLVNFNPTNAAMLDVFRIKYGVHSGVTILGPYGGKLNNSGDTIELTKPTTPVASSVPLVLVDRVDYRDSAPWPAGADGFGLSLQRRDASAYGNDPTNWIAAPPTAATSAPATGAAPVITSPPHRQTVLAYSDATLSVSASGTPPLQYQWRFNGVNLPGATNSVLWLRNLQPDQLGDYSVVVFNGAGSTVSTNATLNLLFPASILAQPQSIYVRPGSNVTFSVLAYSPTPLTYQWFLNNSPLPGATSDTLTIPNAQPADSGSYAAVVTDAIDSVRSAPAVLTVLVDPFIVLHPLSQTVVAGGSVTLSVGVTNTATLPIGYRIRRNNSTLLPGPNTFFTLNQRTAFITFTGTNAAPPWTNYAIIATNIARQSGYLSASAFLTYLADTDGDGLPDDWENAHGFRVDDPSDSTHDSDGDTLSNGAEYIAGTDPTDSLSYLRVNRIAASPPSATLEFMAVSNRTYAIEHTDHPGGGPWLRFVAVPAHPTNRVESIVDSTATNAHRVYRLQTPASNP